MIHIKRFLDKVSHMDSKRSKDLVLPMSEARVLRDEIAKLLADLHELNNTDKNKEEVIKVEIKGGGFK
jgi:5-bromo-4-chloroindolyl phosphate hydrolysis protein